MAPVKYLVRSAAPRLAWRIDLPSGNVSGKVLLIHGFADHSGRFDHVAGAWNDKGLAVLRLDLRGHGLSAGTRGHIRDFSDYLTDVLDVLHAASNEVGWSGGTLPVVFGHSMGGLVAAHTALLFPERMIGLALSSPFFQTVRPLSVPERTLVKIGSRLLPGFRQRSGLAGSELTHDDEIAARYDADPLHFGHVTAGWMAAIRDAQTEALARAPEIRTPLYGIAAGDDHAVSVAATERFFSSAGSAEKELIVRAGLYHEILNEPEWEDIAALFADRMLRWSRAE